MCIILQGWRAPMPRGFLKNIFKACAGALKTFYIIWQMKEASGSIRNVFKTNAGT